MDHEYDDVKARPPSITPDDRKLNTRDDTCENTTNVIGAEVSLMTSQRAQQEEYPVADVHSPRSQGKLQMEYGAGVIDHLSEMKADLWDRFDKNKDGLLSSREALSFVRTLLKQFLAVLAEDLPNGTAEKAAFDKTAPDKEVQKELASVFLKTLDTDNDGQTTKDEFFAGFEVALRAVLDKLFLLHFGGNQEALDVAQPELILFINSPGLPKSHKVQIPKFKTVNELRELLEATLGVRRANQRLWNGFTRLSEIPSETNTLTLDQCSRRDPPLRNLDELHLVGSDGTQVQQRNRLFVTVVRLRRSRGFGSDPVFIECHPDWSNLQATQPVATSGAVTEFDSASSSFEWTLEPHLLNPKAGRSNAYFSVRLFQQSKPGHVGEAYLNLECVLNEPKLCEILGPYGQGRYFETPVPLVATEQSSQEMKTRPTFVVLRFGYRPSD